jgi:hypothetical protein
MLATHQLAGMMPDVNDWLKMNVRTSADSVQVSMSTHGNMSSELRDFLVSNPDSSLTKLFLVTSKLGISG